MTDTNATLDLEVLGLAILKDAPRLCHDGSVCVTHTSATLIGLGMRSSKTRHNCVTMVLSV